MTTRVLETVREPTAKPPVNAPVSTSATMMAVGQRGREKDLECVWKSWK